MGFYFKWNLKDTAEVITGELEGSSTPQVTSLYTDRPPIVNNFNKSSRASMLSSREGIRCVRGDELGIMTHFACQVEQLECSSESDGLRTQFDSGFRRLAGVAVHCFK